MVVQAFGGHRALARGCFPARRLALRRRAAGVDPRQLARERAGRQASAVVPGKACSCSIVHIVLSRSVCVVHIIVQ